MAVSAVLDISLCGDVILVCGREEKECVFGRRNNTSTVLTLENRKRIRVSAAIQSEASKVFQALLSPRFKEGTGLAADATVEIPLPDDDADTMVSFSCIRLCELSYCTFNADIKRAS